MHRLDAPAALDEGMGQPVEQLGMRRRLAVLAEVARRRDDPPAEMLLPDPVDHHPGGQRVVGARDPPRQRHAPAAGGELPVAVGLDDGRLGVARDGAGEARLDVLPRLPVVAPEQDMGRGDARPVRGARGRCRPSATTGFHRSSRRTDDVERRGQFLVARLLLLAEEGARRVRSLDLLDERPRRLAPRISPRDRPRAARQACLQLLQEDPLVGFEGLLLLDVAGPLRVLPAARRAARVPPR